MPSPAAPDTKPSGLRKFRVSQNEGFRTSFFLGARKMAPQQGGSRRREPDARGRVLLNVMIIAANTAR